jgi:hypothetical protein
MGLHEIMAHNIFTRFYILRRADDNEASIYIYKKKATRGGRE